MIGKKLRIDHSKSVRDIVGEVDKAEYDEINKRILAEAVVKDEVIANKIRQGLIDAVSVGLDCDEETLFDQDRGTNIVFNELSLVTDPADDNARLIEVLNSKDYKDVKTKLFELMEAKRMATEATGKPTNEPDTLPPAKKKDEEPVAATATKPKAELQDEVNGLGEVMALLKEILATMQSEKEAPEEMQDEEPEKKDEEDKEKEKMPELAKMHEEIKLLKEQNEKLLQKGSRKTVSTVKGSTGNELRQDPISKSWSKENPFGTRTGQYGPQF